VTTREQPGADGRLPLAHVSDHLRRVVPDGLEDLTHAAAFEIGRLLALSQPSVIAALTRWRREQFGAERARRLARRALEGLTALAPALSASVASLGAIVARQFVLEASRSPDKTLAPARPLVDPGRRLRVPAGSLDEVIAAGFGLPLARVREMVDRVGPVRAIGEVTVPRERAARTSEESMARLGNHLGAVVDGMTAQALGDRRPVGPGPIAAERPPDALDELLDAAIADTEVQR
jgi:hypothetical protein